MYLELHGSMPISTAGVSPLSRTTSHYKVFWDKIVLFRRKQLVIFSDGPLNWLTSNYHYTFEFRPTHKHSNADALSRLPLPEKPASVPVPVEMVLLMEMLQSAPVTAVQIARWTRTDPTLAKVLRCIKEGWPNHTEDVLKPYWQR